jgi:hypothetical protein
MPTAYTLVVASLVALAIYTALMVALHLLPTGFNPRRDPVSLYAAGPFGWLNAPLAQLAAGLCALGMAAAFVWMGAPLPGFGLAALILLGLARLALNLVPARLSDTQIKPGEPLPRRVIAHDLLAVLSFGAIAIVVMTLTGPLIAWSAWRGSAPWLIVTAIYTPLAVIMFPVSAIVAPLRPYFGLFQRAIYVGIICWQALVLIPLAR